MFLRVYMSPSPTYDIANADFLRASEDFSDRTVPFDNIREWTCSVLKSLNNTPIRIWLRVRDCNIFLYLGNTQRVCTSAIVI